MRTVGLTASALLLCALIPATASAQTLPPEVCGPPSVTVPGVVSIHPEGLVPDPCFFDPDQFYPPSQPPDVCEPGVVPVGPVGIDLTWIHPCLINPDPLVQLPCLVLDDLFPGVGSYVAEGADLVVGITLETSDYAVSYTGGILDGVQPGPGGAVRDVYAPASGLLHEVQPHFSCTAPAP